MHLKRIVALVIALAALALAATGCGGGDGGSDGAGAGGDSSTLTRAELRDRYRPDESDRKIQGDGRVERFGRALPDDKAEDVVAVAAGYYDARSGRDWGRACDLLSSAARERVEELFNRAPGLKGKDCAGVMTVVSPRIPQGTLAREAAGMRFNEVRVKGNRAFAIFKSKALPNGAVEMVREKGQWKVAAMSPTPL